MNLSNKKRERNIIVTIKQKNLSNKKERKIFVIGRLPICVGRYRSLLWETRTTTRLRREMTQLSALYREIIFYMNLSNKKREEIYCYINKTKDLTNISNKKGFEEPP